MKKYLLLLVIAIIAASAFGQQPGMVPPDAQYIKDNYEKHEYNIPMRDGKTLFTSVYTPKDQSKKYPFMMDRTCYSVAPYGAAYKARLAHQVPLCTMATSLFTRMYAAVL